ncbi:DUF1850 domain-containing protein [Roseicitreum antarcticum]|uniref:DUF1850 domain-containing protein n=1 Tax=Roseicitreum antarcticum TaxID=564137 RepID=A0A1H2VX00_9RHOB|nr:DUF1850 domain-containing protein [Roseicitreum antarcticum]SDW72860.1 protein of unknown function [Roseicitreum antarcticum]
MTGRDRRKRTASVVPALVAMIFGMGGPLPAHACKVTGLSVVRLTDDTVLARAQAQEFTLIWRHSVTLTPVYAAYAIDADGTLRQTEERFAAHGPGMAFGGEGWQIRGDQMVLTLNRPIPQLILRSDIPHQNRLIAGDTEIDLTRWPGVPLEIRATPCKDPVR